MDVSLDDYISTSNFKIKIGNPGFKGNKPANVGTQGGFQQGKKRFGNFNTGNKVTDVSVTVTGVPKAVGKSNVTNQVRDARERLISKPVVQDARQKLNQKAPADARQKLQTIRARKGPTDARAKITAKQQQQQPQNVTVANPAAAQPRFTLTRTVTNSNKNNAHSGQVSAGSSGNIQITRTLTKVMPPGYEALVGATPSAASPAEVRQTSSVKSRLGPPQGRQGKMPTITRTVANNNPQRQQPKSARRSPVRTVQPDPQYQTYIQPEAIPQQPFRDIQIESHVRPPRIHAPPPQQYQAPPLPQQYLPPQHQAPPPQYQAPPTYIPIQPPNQAPPQHTVRYEGPPYPVTDPVPVRQQTIAQPTEMPLPRFEVQNDQYRPPPPPQQYPPYPTSAPQHPPYPYSPSPQHSYYPSQPEPPIQRTVPKIDSPSPYIKIVTNDYIEEDSFEPPSLKRKSTSASGPLKLSSTNTIPVLTSASGQRAASERSAYRSNREEPPLKRTRQEPQPLTDEDNVISPLQGYKIVITNLFTSVTQDDIIELFGAIGAVKKVRLLKPGSAEVVYVKREHAIEATKIYHERELDGQPMVVKMITPVSAKVKEAPESLPPGVKPATTGPLKLGKKPTGPVRSTDKKGLEVDILHKALFRTGTTAQSKPVTFTVNI